MQRGQIFQISAIDTYEVPPLFSLVDLMKDKVPGHFYKEELVKAPSVEYKKDFFEIEKILKKKKVRSEIYYFVKFMFYPPKFNDWINSKNMNIKT